MMLHKAWPAWGASLLFLAACQPADDAAVANADNVLENGMNEMAGNETAVAPTAADFAAEVARSDLYEIESGKLAAEKASSAEIKDFARMLVADHEKSTADLKAALAGINPPITVEPVLDGDKLAMVDMLRNSPAGEFDKAFIDQQKQAHQKALDLLRNYQSSGDNQALKDFAAKASTVVQAHLDKLNAMQP